MRWKHLQIAILLCWNFRNIVYILRKTIMETQLLSDYSFAQPKYAKIWISVKILQAISWRQCLYLVVMCFTYFSSIPHPHTKHHFQNVIPLSFFESLDVLLISSESERNAGCLMIPSLKVHIYKIVHCCSNKLCCTLIMQTHLAVFAVPLLSCAICNVQHWHSVDVQGSLFSFQTCIHTLYQWPFAKPRSVIYSRKWAQQTRWTHSCISFTDADEQNKHRCHESAFDDQSSWCRCPSHVNHRINKLFVSLHSAESSWKSVSTILQQATLEWWIYFFNGFHGIL